VGLPGRGVNVLPWNNSVDDSVIDTMPLLDKTLLKVIDAVDTGTLDSSLQKSVQR